MPHPLQLLVLTLFPLGVLAAALTDVTSFIIPNRLNAAIALAFVPAALCVGLPWTAFGACALAGVLGLAGGMALFTFRVIGGGDAKLMAACLLWLGPQAATPFLVWTAVAGGGLALTLIAMRRAPGLAAAGGPAWIGRLLRPQGEAPYGVAIAVGALAAFPSAPIAHVLQGL